MMNRPKLMIIGLFFIVVLAGSVFAGVVIESGLPLLNSNQIIIGCSNNIAQKLIDDYRLDSDDCIFPGDNSARIKLIRIGEYYQLLLVGDAVGLEAAVEVLRHSKFYSTVLSNDEVIASRNITTNITDVIAVTAGFVTSTVPLLVSLGNGSYQYSIQLQQGWNFVSFPIVLEDTTPEGIFNAIKSKMIRVFSYNPSSVGVKWLKWNPEAGAPNEINQIKPQVGYIIYMNESTVLTVKGRASVGFSEVPPVLALSSGWNLITPHSFRPREASVALSSISGKYDSLWTFVNNEITMLDLNSDPLLQPSQIYWIHMISSGSLAPS